jgi:NAD(P)-dependent dehydrogenase (short-subunit alcohol dehydrogenase family)
VHYAASKAAIDIFTRGLANEVADHGIWSNGVRPGLTMTDINPPDRVEVLLGTIPPRCGAQPDSTM